MISQLNFPHHYSRHMIPQKSFKYSNLLLKKTFIISIMKRAVLSNDFPISFTRNELLDIRNSTPDNLLPTFEHSDVLLNIIVGGAAFLYKRSRRRKRGKRAGALVKTRQRSLRTPLPSIHLANLRSLANKSDELQLLTCTNKDFSNSAALFHGNLAERSYPGQRASSIRIPAVQSRQSHRIIGENERWWIMFLYQ